VLDLGVNTVYLQAFADPDGDGVADALYFPNRHLPMRADLFNRVAWQLRTRTGVTVYAWMPVLGFALDMPGHLVLARSGDGPDMPAPEAYRRLSPFSGAAARVVGEIYRDLAKHAAFAGLIFHDDAFLSDYEDANPAALEAYRQAGLPESFASIREEVGLLERWTEVKSQRLNGFIAALIEDVLVYRPEIKTARNIFARPVLEPAARHWFAQSLDGFMAQYDYPAIMAMPYMEEAENPDQWLKKLVEAVAAVPGALDQVVFELQSRDWRTGQPVDGSTLARQMELLQSAGVKHYGYYPDDFLNNRPEARLVRPQISSRTIPYRP
jgi:biofilm PGA synthesis lipoprotein PgaB